MFRGMSLLFPPLHHLPIHSPLPHLLPPLSQGWGKLLSCSRWVTRCLGLAQDSGSSGHSGGGWAVPLPYLVLLCISLLSWDQAWGGESPSPITATSAIVPGWDQHLCSQAGAGQKLLQPWESGDTVAGRGWGVRGGDGMGGHMPLSRGGKEENSYLFWGLWKLMLLTVPTPHLGKILDLLLYTSTSIFILVL